jgi:AcrR family transcriptional regulator
MSGRESAPVRSIAESGGDHRTRPRRRGHALDTAILQATIVEIDLHGYAGFSMERVAERARASKASLYRRWPSKVELVLAAVYQMLPDPAAAAGTGTLRGDVLAVLSGAAELLAGPAGTAIRGLVSDALRDPELSARLRQYTRGRSVAAMREVVRQAVERGELRPDMITAAQLEAGLAMLRYHFLTHDGPVAEQVIIEIVDEVVLPLFRAVSGVDQPGV